VLRFLGGNDVRLESLGMRIENLIGEPGSNFTYRLVFLHFGVIAGEEIRAVGGFTFSSAVECSEYDEVEGISYTSQIILFNLSLHVSSAITRQYFNGEVAKLGNTRTHLEPIHRPLGRFI